MSNFFVSAWFFILKVVFTFLHIVYSGLQYFDTAWGHFRRKCEAMFYLNVTDTEQYVSRFVTSLEKCPRHLALIVGNEAIKCEDFANIAIWSFAAGVSFLTVYDCSGVLLENEAKFHNYILKSTRMLSENIIFRNLKVKNGFSKDLRNKLIVSFLQKSDGMQAFSDLIVKLGSTRKVDDIEQDVISEELNVIYKFPDPDLAIIVGPVVSTYGYPPWKIRLTEFLRLSTIDGISARKFCQLLQRYSNCQQRCGK